MGDRFFTPPKPLIADIIPNPMVGSPGALAPLVSDAPPPVSAHAGAEAESETAAPANTSESQHDQLQAANNRRFSTPPAFSPGGAGQVVMPEGYSAAPIGGQQGEADYETAFGTLQDNIHRGSTEIGQLQAQRSKELAGLYGAERDRSQQAAAIAAARRAERQAETERRQKELDDATQRYSSDLHSTGKFWQNPGNIIAAISFSLMPIVSNDPAIGAKLINTAIEQDMAHRKDAANMTLGALRSNLRGYRDIAQDEQAGDMLAESEAHRMAALEIQRLGAKFEGPISQKKAKVLADSEMAKAMALRMEFFNRYMYRPARPMDKRLADAQYTGPGGQAAFADPFAGPPQGYDPGKAEVSPYMRKYLAAEQGGPPVKGSPSLANGVPQQAAQSGSSYAGARPEDVQEFETARSNLTRQLILDGHRTPESLRKAWGDHVAAAQKNIQIVAPELAKIEDTRKNVSDLRGRIKWIRETSYKLGKDPEAFRSWGRQILPTSIVQKWDDLNASDPNFANTKNAKLEALQREAVKEFEGQVMNTINSIYHEKFGGAQSASGPGGGEVGRGQAQIRMNMSLEQMENALRAEDTKATAKVKILQSNWDDFTKSLYRVSTLQSMKDVSRNNPGTGPKPKGNPGK